MRINKLIKHIIKSHGYSVRQFAFENNLNYTRLNDMINGRSNPGLKTIIAVKRTFPEVDLNELITDKFPQTSHNTKTIIKNQ